MPEVLQLRASGAHGKLGAGASTCQHRRHWPVATLPEWLGAPAPASAPRGADCRCRGPALEACSQTERVAPPVVQETEELIPLIHILLYVSVGEIRPG